MKVKDVLLCLTYCLAVAYTFSWSNLGCIEHPKCVIGNQIRCRLAFSLAVNLKKTVTPPAYVNMLVLEYSKPDRYSY